MRWPWKRKSSQDQLVVSWSGGVFAYAMARANADGLFALQKMGVERQGADSMDDFVRRLQALGLKGMVAHAMLRPEQYQLLQIDAPPVAPEELRAAARFQIREMVNVHIDDITLDVMQVGDGQQKGPNNLFVVAAKSDVVRTVIGLGDALNWKMPVIDIQEMAQRNLQSALAKQEGRLERADAALLITDELQAVLTISANEELFFTRRLDLPQGFLSMTWDAAQDVVAQAAPDAFTPVSEYVPDYAGGGATTTGSADHGDADRVQRFLVEVQRSLDLWDRTWSSMPLGGLRVYAGERSAELASCRVGHGPGDTVPRPAIHGQRRPNLLPAIAGCAVAHRNPQTLSLHASTRRHAPANQSVYADTANAKALLLRAHHGHCAGGFFGTGRRPVRRVGMEPGSGHGVLQTIPGDPCARGHQATGRHSTKQGARGPGGSDPGGAAGGAPQRHCPARKIESRTG